MMIAALPSVGLCPRDTGNGAEKRFAPFGRCERRACGVGVWMTD